jgi:hypothetical protein
MPKTQAAEVAATALPSAELRPVHFSPTESQLEVEETTEWTLEAGVVELDRALPGGIRIIVTSSEATVNGEVLIEIGRAGAVARALLVAPKLIGVSADSLSNALKVESRRIVIDGERSCVQTISRPNSTVRSSC